MQLMPSFSLAEGPRQPGAVGCLGIPSPARARDGQWSLEAEP